VFLYFFVQIVVFNKYEFFTHPFSGIFFIHNTHWGPNTIHGGGRAEVVAAAKQMGNDPVRYLPLSMV